MAQRYLADISGQLNASGVGFVTSDPMLIWTKAIVTAQAPNSPTATWTVGIGTHTGVLYHPLAVGMIGSSISCGPYTLAPGEVLVVSLVGGGVSDTLKASLFGLQDVDPNNVGMDTAVGSSSSVQINGGTVTATISGTVPVTITGTPTVNIGNTPAVSISGTPTVNIGGTAAVSITANSVNFPVFNATGTKITSARPPLSLGQVAVAASGTVTTIFTIPPDTQGLVIRILNALTTIAHIKVQYHPTSGSTIGPVPFESYSFPQAIYVIPLLPSGYDNSLNVLTTIDVTLDSTNVGTARLDVWALFEANPLWMQLFPQPQLEPNQTPQTIDFTMTVALTQYAIIAAVANVQVNLFDVSFFGWLGVPAGQADFWSLGYGTGGAATEIASGLTSFGPGPANQVIDFKGAPLPRGKGLYIYSTQAGISVNGVATYSLS